MPVGLQRLNARRSQPNPHIVFIKPLPGPDEAVARQFLERIAAQCVPVMRDHHLSIVTLEEFPPNREFVGRNFNAGEVVQLVLRARGSGAWLPFAYVQMVMMHELAHCRQMNHTRAFWAVRDAFAAHMRRLWADRYTGDGVWGRGARLGCADGTAPYERNVATTLPGRGSGDGGNGSDGGDDGASLEHLCGGAYRSRGRKRKPKAPPLTYREREDRRVRRKFGTNGVALGDDLAERRARVAAAAAAAAAVPSKTEQKRLATKPRVAASKRGRDLRAAAALARFAQTPAKEEEEDPLAAIKGEEQGGPGYSTDSDDDGPDDGSDDGPDDGPDAVDIDGTQLRDGRGRGMVRVCEGEGAQDDADAKRELRELLEAAAPTAAAARRGPPSPPPSSRPAPRSAAVKREPGAAAVARPLSLHDIPYKASPAPPLSLHDIPYKANAAAARPAVPPAPGDPCPVCSSANGALAVTCAVCGHVLDADAVPGAWHCASAACRAGADAGAGVRFRNAGDCGVCGACGQRRPGDEGGGGG